MDMGARLRDARERAGLSRDQIADATKVKVERIEALEENAFERLPSGIYLHGIIRSYAHEVGLDADELTQQLRTSPGNPQREAELADLDLIAELRSSRPAQADELPAGADEFVGGQQVARRSGDRGAHAAALAALVVVLLGAFATGGYLYQTGSRKAAVERQQRHPPDSQNPEVSRTSGSQVDAAESPQAHVPPPAKGGQSGSQQSTSPRAISTTGVNNKSAEPLPVSSASREESKHRAASGDTVTGVWRISTQLTESNVSKFRGLQLAFVLDLHQEGDRIVGSGRKVAENGHPVRPAAQTPITVAGRIDGDQVTLTFKERGARRESTGTFELTRASDDLLRGRFSSDVARSAGAVEARRR